MPALPLGWRWTNPTPKPISLLNWSASLSMEELADDEVSKPALILSELVPKVAGRLGICEYWHVCPLFLHFGFLSSISEGIGFLSDEVLIPLRPLWIFLGIVRSYSSTRSRDAGDDLVDWLLPRDPSPRLIFSSLSYVRRDSFLPRWFWVVAVVG